MYKGLLCAGLIGLASARELPTESNGVLGSLRKLLAGGQDTITLLQTHEMTSTTNAVDLKAVGKSIKKNWRKVASTFYDYDFAFTGGDGSGDDEYDYDSDGEYDTIGDGDNDIWDGGNTLYVCVASGEGCDASTVANGWFLLNYKNSATPTTLTKADGRSINYITIKRPKVMFAAASSDGCFIRGFNIAGERGETPDYHDYWDAPMQTKYGMYTVFMSQEYDTAYNAIHRLIIAPKTGAKQWNHYVDYDGTPGGTTDYDREYAMSESSGGGRVCNVFYILLVSVVDHTFSYTDLRVIAGNFIYYVLDQA